MALASIASYAPTPHAKGKEIIADGQRIEYLTFPFFCARNFKPFFSQEQGNESLVVPTPHVVTPVLSVITDECLLQTKESKA
jgi:hypothetical protein